MKPADRVWNRACIEMVRDRPGDRALADVIALDGPASNGGWLHGLEFVGKAGVERAIAGDRYFGMHDVANMLATFGDRADAVGPDDFGPDAELLEEQANRYLWDARASERLMVMFERRFVEAPEDFAPLGPLDAPD